MCEPVLVCIVKADVQRAETKRSPTRWLSPHLAAVAVAELAHAVGPGGRLLEAKALGAGSSSQKGKLMAFMSGLIKQIRRSLMEK